MTAELKLQSSADSKEIHLCWKHIRQSVLGQHFGGPHGDQRKPKALGVVNKQVEYLQIEPTELTDFLLLTPKFEDLSLSWIWACVLLAFESP